MNASAYEPAYARPSHEEPLVWCDGGVSAWGALVDVEAERVLSVQVNGEFGGPPTECAPSKTSAPR